MFKILTAAVLIVLFSACSSSDDNLANVTAKIVVGESLTPLTLNDQFEKSHTLSSDTKTVIFALSKDAAHTCNDFFKTKKKSYLEDNNAAFIADVSAAPSLIRSMFILPGLKEFEHTVLLLEDKAKAAPFRKGVDVEKILIVKMKDGKIAKISSVNAAKALQVAIEAK